MEEGVISSNSFNTNSSPASFFLTVTCVFPEKPCSWTPDMFPHMTEVSVQEKAAPTEPPAEKTRLHGGGYP